MRDEGAIGQLWEVTNGHWVSGKPRSVSHYLIVDHTVENVVCDPSGAWIMFDILTGETRLRSRLYSDNYWQRIL